MSENLIIFNARIVTPIGFSARKGEEMSQLQVIENGTWKSPKESSPTLVRTVAKTATVTINTTGIITLADTASCPASLIPIPILYLAENVPKNSPGV